MNSVHIEQGWSGLRATTLYVAVLAAIAASWFIFSYGYIEDDAFIHLEFARSVAEGNGFAFNGHVTYGDTAPLWVLILVGIHALGLGWIVSAKAACVAGLVVAVSGAWRVGSELARANPDNPVLQLLPVAAVLVTVVNPYFVHWSFSGMESVAALGLSFWAISIGLLAQPTLRGSCLAAVLLGIGPLMRPEFVLLDAIVGPLLLWRFWHARVQLSVARRAAIVVALGLLMSLPVLIWSGYALQTFGAIVPNTNKAKQGGPIDQIAPRLLSVYALGFPVTLALLPFVALPRLMRQRVPLPVTVLLLWPLACVCFYLANHTILQTRYALLSMPSTSIAALWLIGAARRPGLFAGATVAMALAAILTISVIVVPHIVNKQKRVDVRAQMSAYMRERVPVQSPVAVYAIGEIAFESRHPLVDTGGITDQSVIPHMSNPAETLAWAKARGAGYYIASSAPERGAVPVFTATEPFVGWTFHRSMYETRDSISIYRLP